MLKQIRREVVSALWNLYCERTPQMQGIAAGMKKRGVSELALDHFAVIDLPGPHSGLEVLQQLFSAIGYLAQGRDYLADKQNEFLWMTEVDCLDTPVREVLPQVVVADFRLEELPCEIRKIIEKYSRYVPASPLADIQRLTGQAFSGDVVAAEIIRDRLIAYLSARDWPLPSVNEFSTVHEFNELLAWVLVFGRQPNHFTISVHLLEGFAKLEQFSQFVGQELQFTLNQEGGVIKGGQGAGIAQGSTQGALQQVELADGVVQLPTGFVEFVWRYPRKQNPLLWQDFFTDFIAQHANRVIESLYVVS
ncbi:MAG: hypothetical protein A3J38_02275 [Gammaproteobacteria bacterium RIFCSPHIGHO2_12_FULL_45_9]|nr:MAG: hypothetical protein A3J38_02275 [Gammaproteobacteria bacterium RIFCSPHIGHO2_12_FULL_45_9]